jgi:hypothetical protein
VSGTRVVADGARGGRGLGLYNTGFITAYECLGFVLRFYVIVRRRKFGTVLPEVEQVPERPVIGPPEAGFFAVEQRNG